MSIASSWLSIAGISKEAVLAALELRDSGAEVQPGTTEFAGAVLADGGYLLVAQGFHSVVHPRSLEALSGEATVFACAQSESTNAALAWQWRRGKRVWEVWAVAYSREEGRTHLEVKGRAPKALDALLAAAVKSHEESGHDAVFSVPGALACKAAGHAAGATPGLRFTRLELTSDDAFASPASVWRRVRMEEAANAFEKAVLDLPAALTPVLEKALAPLGFAPATRPGVKHGFARTAGDLMLQVRLISAGHGRLDAAFEASHALIDRALLEYLPNIESWGDLPYGVTLSELEGRRGFYEVHDAQALEAFGALLEARLPMQVAALADLRALDRAMAQTYAGRPLVNYLLKRRFQLVIGAWLTGNPALAEMVEASAPTEERRAQFDGLLALLEEKYQPLE